MAFNAALRARPGGMARKACLPASSAVSDDFANSVAWDEFPVEASLGGFPCSNDLEGVFGVAGVAGVAGFADSAALEEFPGNAVLAAFPFPCPAGVFGEALPVTVAGVAGFADSAALEEFPGDAVLAAFPFPCPAGVFGEALPVTAAVAWSVVC
ncbi:MAG: hypothetical protein FJ037_08290 [Chloroflexi bacterium]|nr:hypothetical protein [Chloroflexota bacterium]